MKILVIGGGGREHALGDKLHDANPLNEIIFAPGNAGTESVGINADLDIENFYEVARFCKREQVDLVVVGPEKPLVRGIVDFLRENGITVFGPSKEAAILEGSKAFAKNFMKRNGIPTASYEIFKKDDKSKLLTYLSTINYPIVLKADGLAAGKGVTICENLERAIITIDEYFEKSKFGIAGKTIVVEEFLRGKELSVFVITDGENYVMLPPSQDHKKIFDGERGPNTGGMGAYAPLDFVTEEIFEEIEDEIVIPTLRGMKKEEKTFSGCLYCGLILTQNGVKVIEYNARFGDPETQSVLSLLDGRFDMLLLSAAQGLLDKDAIRILEGMYSVNVVAASAGYPGSYEKGKKISGLETLDNEVKVFHAGTVKREDEILTDGGRVLSVSAVASSLEEARNVVYDNLSRISFEGIYYRKDIAAEK